MGFRMGNVDGRAVLVDGERFYDVERISGGAVGADPMVAVGQGEALSDLAGALGDHEPDGPVDGVTLGPPVPRPVNSFGIGLNYRSHAAESKMDLPSAPVVFTKFPSCIVGPTADVEMRSDSVDYEGELVVVIGRTGKDIGPDDAWHHVAGLTVGQDVSDRPVQLGVKPPQFNLGKSFDTFGPTGPVVVSPDALDDPADLHLTTHVGDEKRQDDRTSNLIFDIPFLVCYLSRICTLRPGDLIFTGTPEGVGMVSGDYLTDGDVVTTTIDGIGSLRNTCRRVSDHRC